MTFFGTSLSISALVPLYQSSVTPADRQDDENDDRDAHDGDQRAARSEGEHSDVHVEMLARIVRDVDRRNRRDQQEVATEHAGERQGHEELACRMTRSARETHGCRRESSDDRSRAHHAGDERRDGREHEHEAAKVPPPGALDQVSEEAREASLLKPRSHDENGRNRDDSFASKARECLLRREDP